MIGELHRRVRRLRAALGKLIGELHQSHLNSVLVIEKQYYLNARTGAGTYSQASSGAQSFFNHY